MVYKVDGWNNFCRVFELPVSFPQGFCFGGGITTPFQMVDWFNPVPDICNPAVSKEVWEEKVGKIEIVKVDHDELCNSLVPWLREKIYVKAGKTYLIICDFGASFIFTR
jgi:hypothetical protein